MNSQTSNENYKAEGLQTGSLLKQAIQKLFNKAKIRTIGVNYHESSRSTGFHYIYDERMNVLLGTDKKGITERSDNNKILRQKVFKIDNATFLVIYKEGTHTPQVLGSIFSKIQSVFSSLMSVRAGVKSIFSKEFGFFIFDLIRMILDIREGWLSPGKVLTTLMSLYSIYDRFIKLGEVYRAQVYFLNDITFDSIVLMFSAIGVPKTILDTIKTFTDITGRKLFNSSMVMNVISVFYDLLKSFLMWMTEAIPSLNGSVSFIENIVDYLFSTIVCYSKIKDVVTLYSKYVSDASVILDPKFRLDCEELHDKLVKDTIFREYIDNIDNRHFKLTWDSFCNNLIKYVKNFDVARREEPICIVLEGPPGCGKSVLMNNLVEYLVRLNMSVYVHSVPPTMGGKDFYDDYENQDVFVMDDVGQQGVSQWRTIINFVAPIKYPLECAEAKKKNTKFFNSKIIIVTTNRFTELNSFTSSDCISEPDALFRRAHVIKMARGAAPHGKHAIDMEYLKYDYKNSKSFVNSFLYHNATDSLPAKAEGMNTKDSLIYAMSVLKHLRKTEEANRNSTLMTEAEFTEVDVILEDFDKNGYASQAGLGDYFSTLGRDFADLISGNELFNEWINAIKNKFSNITNYLCSFLSEMMGVGPTDLFEEQRRILTARDPYTVFNLSSFGTTNEKVLKTWRKLSLKYHPDKASPSNREMYGILQRILNMAKESILASADFQYDSTADAAFSDDSGKRAAKATKAFVKELAYIISQTPYRIYDAFHTFYFKDKVVFYYLILYVIYVVYVIATVTVPNLISYLNPSPTDLDDIWRKQTSEHQEHLGTTGVKDMVLTEITVNTVKKSIRFVLGTRTDGTKFYSQGVVGGRFILLNSHTNADQASINIYNSHEHYRNNHIEQEAVTITKVRDYPSVDLCVYRLERVMLTYRSPKVLFDQKAEIKPFMYLVSSMGIIPMVAGRHFETNKEEISYTAYGVHYKHAINSGFMTTVQGDGLCGTLMVNPSGSIVGVHVAGDGVSGFCVTPSLDMIESIRSFLCAPGTLEFDVDERIKENFSGVRVRYEKDQILVAHVGGDVPMVPSLLHRDYNDHTRKLIGTVHHDDTDKYSSVPDKTINNRKPPNLTNRPAEKLKEMSSKAFKLQGFVTDTELAYIDDCIDSIMPESFTDIDFEEAAFGGELAAMASDTSNGYGHVREKEMFFDFENKKITDYGMQEFLDFEQRINNDCPEFKDFLSKEVFKVNELRNEEKANKPRTIRVMPITHIYWTKVICGQAALHFKNNMHETGVCIGFNPYKDFHTLALRLKGLNIVGDADYGGWDGTLNARIMFRIFEIFERKYKGKHAKILRFLGTSIVRSMVLVADELYATTHGMPSGTWLTLLLNCLVNKAIQALTIFRNKDNATVQDFLDITSYVTGDDDIFGTPPHLEEVFNLQTLKATAESLGMTCTNGDKTEITTKGHEFSRLNYLKRHFRYHPVLNRYMGCLSLSTILNTFQYVDSTKDYEEAMQGKINAVLVEAYVHSEALYYLLSDYFKKECPSYRQLTIPRIQKILSDDEGYQEILQSLGKSYARV